MDLSSIYHRYLPRLNRPPPTTVERIWHMKHSEAQMLALAFRSKSLHLVEMFLVCAIFARQQQQLDTLGDTVLEWSTEPRPLLA